MGTAVTKNKRRPAIEKTVFYALLYLFILAGAFVCVYPLLFTFLSGFFSAPEFMEIYGRLPFFPIPKQPTLANYGMFFYDAYILRTLFNSLFRVVYSVAMSTAMALITGFCFSRLRFKGRNAIFMSLLALSILPSTITLAPTYLMYYKLGLYDTFWVYVLGGPCINVMGGFMVMLSFDKIPREIDDAAKIDGAGYPAILLKVLFPLQIPILTYLAIGTAIATWNDWFMPFYFTSSAALQTLPSALARLSTVAETAFMPNYPLVITLSLGTTIPPLFLFFFFQRYIIEGIGNIGVKG